MGGQGDERGRRDKRDPLAGKVAWVAGVGEGTSELGRGLGRSSALLLASLGARVLVTGVDERALGTCVGEIVHGGGTARHLVSALRSAEEARASVAGLMERFGSLDVAVVASTALEGVARAFDAARDSMGRGGRLVLVVSASAHEPRVTAFVQEVARAFAPRGITCNAVLAGAVSAPIRAAEAEDVAELVAFLCGPAGEVVSGTTIAAS
jgi:NAD(P)-dependent dehydrogenase (short-subunit alcohol dehydrogenase family)